MSQRWNLQRAVQDVDNQVALLHARVAALGKSRASLALAQAQFERARQLLPRADVPREVFDQRQAELPSAGADLTQALARGISGPRLARPAGATRRRRRSRPGAARPR